MTTSNNSALTAVRCFPFTVKPAPNNNGYLVEDVRGYAWATCRDEGYARIIVEGLTEVARDWKSAKVTVTDWEDVEQLTNVRPES